MTLRVCVAGATGWTGRAVAEGILGAEDLVLRSAVSRSAAGSDLGEAWSGAPNGVPVHGTVAAALDEVDVLVDYTSHLAVRGHTLTAIERGVAVVIGTRLPRCWSRRTCRIARSSTSPPPARRTRPAAPPASWPSG
jgi:4-hydroxy-tetrahydrodipicolinate reductase